MSSFAPEHESTQQYDTATQDQLPYLRSSARRFGQWQPPQPEPYINTSFARDEFPDFTENSPSASEEHSASIEIGRGMKNTAHNSPQKNNDFDGMSENPILSLGNDSLYEITATPPIRPRLGSRKSESMDRPDLRREASLRRAKNVQQAEVTKTSDIVPTKTRSTSASQRRTLSEMHAKVNAESDSSFVGEERPQSTLTLNTKSTRFAKARQTSAPQQSLPTRFTSGQGLETAQRTPQRPASAAIVNSARFTGNQTQQSFMLPDLPDITELVSGIRKDGTPVFSRSAKSRSRFTSGSYRPNADDDPSNHARIQSIAVPEDEKAIFASLQLLKEKVLQLEKEKEEARRRAEEYELQTIELKSQVQMEQRLRRSDSPRTVDHDSNAQRVEHTKLQTTIKALHERIERGNRKLAACETAVKRMTQERDDLATQLGVAYYNSEEHKAKIRQLEEENEKINLENEDLKLDMDTLRNENNQLRVQLAQFKAQHEYETQQWTEREAQLKERVEKREEAVREIRDLTREIWVAKKPVAPRTSRGRTQHERKSSQAEELEQRKSSRRLSGCLSEETQDKIIDKVEQELRKSRVEAASTSRRSIGPNQSRARSRSKSQSRRVSGLAQRRTPAGYAAPVDQDVSEIESTTDLEISRPVGDVKRDSYVPTDGRSGQQEDTKDLTYLSFLDREEVARLRKKLEEERRAAREKCQPAAIVETERDITARSSTARLQATPRKSSLRDITGRNNQTSLEAPGDKSNPFTANTNSDEDTTRQQKAVRIQSPHTSDAISYEEPKDVTEASMLSTASRRRQRNLHPEEMTSAFILPDITLHNQTSQSIAGSIPHDKENCTICPPTAGKDATIPTPIPVTDRNVDDTNATIRPSQPPPLALATVLKQLEDEVAHLKLQLSTYEKAYNGHDPALGRRKRKAIMEKMELLITEIERRSDQIYALYDVLEGQKQAAAGEQGRQDEMREDEVEETLQSIGIDSAELAERAAKAQADGRRTSTSSASAGKGRYGLDGLDGLEEESDDELPWEGISDDEDA